MESFVEGFTGVVVVATLGLFGVLVARKRKHLRLVVRVLDQRDDTMVSFLNQMIQSGELVPVQPA